MWARKGRVNEKNGVNHNTNGTLTGLGVSSIQTGGSYCSIDEYSCQCDPQGTRGRGGDMTWGGAIGSGLGGVGIGTNKGSPSRDGLAAGTNGIGIVEDG